MSDTILLESGIKLMLQAHLDSCFKGIRIEYLLLLSSLLFEVEEWRGLES